MNYVVKKSRNAYLCLFAASFLSILLTLAVELIPDGCIPGTVVQKAVNVISESLILLLPYWLLPRRCRILVLIPVLALPLAVLSAVWYLRFWGDLPSLSTIFVVSNFNAETIRSTLALWRFYDVIPVVAALATSVFYFVALRKGAEQFKPTVKYRLLMIAVSLALYFIHLSYETLYQMKFYRRRGVEVHLTDFSTYFKNHFNTGIWLNFADMRDNGFILYIHHNICNTISTFNIVRHLTDKETLKITEFIAENRFEPILNDSLIAANHQKNVIVIIVESLNSDAITPQVSPTLSSLIERQGTVSALNITPQITIGCSGDGQLLANTGLLPLSSISTAFAVGSRNVFPALPRLINRCNPTVVFTDDGTPWNEANTFAHYGFEKIVVNNDYATKYKTKGLDRALMEVADSLIGKLQQPFLLELLTGSMHAPFNDQNIPQSEINQSITSPNKQEQDYLRMVNYFDASVNFLIGALQARNLLENTMIFIISDHTTNAYIKPNTPAPTMAFIAANTGITAKIESNRLQSDVFPTILQLSGANDSTVWKGAGRTLLGIGQDEEWQITAKEISELILRGDYFKEKFSQY